MALYVDTAMAQEAHMALRLGMVAGVTTNPTLIKRTGRNEHEVLSALISLKPQRLFVQLSGNTEDDLSRHLERIRTAFPSGAMVFKITPTWPAMALCAKWHDQVTFLVTAVNTVEQAYVAAESGAQYIAIYLHRYRLRHGAWPPIQDMKAMARTTLRVMMASCHDLEEVRWSLSNGADDLTLPLSTIQLLLASKDSEDDIARFDHDSSRLPRN